jgi:hypothetical protein
MFYKLSFIKEGLKGHLIKNTFPAPHIPAAGSHKMWIAGGVILVWE